MKRIFAILAAGILMLNACTAAGVKRGTTVTTIPGTADTALPRQFSFAVGQNSDEILILAAENFCRRVNSLSDGDIILTLSKTEEPLDDFQSGKAAFVLLNGEGATAIHPLFSIAREPFRYRSYENFSMSCNSVHILRALSDACGANVFAAYYTGSSLFAGFAPFDSVLAFERGGTLAREANALTIPGSGADFSLELLGVPTEAVPSASARLQMLSSGNSIAEFSFSELIPEELSAFEPDPAGQDAPDSGEDILDGEDAQNVEDADFENLVLTRTFHSIVPAWLILAPELYESFSPRIQAAVDEAAAFMTGDIDSVYLKDEQNKIDLLYAEGLDISDNFTGSRTRILNRYAELYGSGLSPETRLRELLGRLS